MKKTRIIVLITVAALIVGSVLTGCGPNGSVEPVSTADAMRTQIADTIVELTSQAELNALQIELNTLRGTPGPTATAAPSIPPTGTPILDAPMILTHKDYFTTGTEQEYVPSQNDLNSWDIIIGHDDPSDGEASAIIWINGTFTKVTIEELFNSGMHYFSSYTGVYTAATHAQIIFEVEESVAVHIEGFKITSVFSKYLYP